MLPDENEIEQNIGETKSNFLKSHEKYFNPYYGALIKWDNGKANGLLKEFANKMKEIGRFETSKNRWANEIFVIQDKLLNYPFKTFMPHLSLTIHHQLSASLFLFLYEELKKYDSLKDLKEFKFSVIEITPDLLRNFYRMRDVSGLHLLTNELSTEIVCKLFGHYRKELYGVPNKKSNPFLFYNT